MTSCKRPVFFPGGPCCGAVALCPHWPKIDWNAFTWKLRQPHAVAEDYRYAWHSYPNSPLVTYPMFNGDGQRIGTEVWASVITSLTDEPADNIFGTIFIENVHVSWHSYHYRANDYRASYNGGCTWTVSSVERLLVGRNLMISLDGGTFQRILSFEHFSGGGITLRMTPYQPTEWTQRRFYNDTRNNYPPFNNNPVDVYNLGENQGLAAADGSYISWRDVLKAVACTLIPLADQNGWTLSGYAHQQTQLGELEVRSDVVRSTPFYRPNAMDLAVQFALEPGHILKVVNGELRIFSDVARFYTGLNLTPSYSPWRLISHEMVEPELGRVHRFERTDANPVLPEWLELELVRV